MKGSAKGVVTAVLAAVIALATYYLYRPGAHSQLEEPHTQETTKNFSLKDSLQAKIDTPLTDSKTYNAAKVECQKTYDFFLNNDLDTLMVQLRSLNDTDEQCLKKLIPDLTNLETCKTLDLTAEQKNQCSLSLLKARTKLIDQMYQDFTNFMGMDLKILSARLFSRFMDMLQGKLSPKEVDELKQMSQALMDRVPGKVEPVKMRVITEIMGGDGIMTSPVLDDLVRRGLEIDGSNKELTEVLLFREAQKPAGEAFISEFARRNPNSAISYYWLASVTWKNLNKPLTIQHLQTAIHLDSSEQRFHDTLAKVQTHAPGTKDLFSVNVGAKLDGL